MPSGFGLGIESILPLVLYIGGIIAFLLSLFWRPQIGLYYLVPLLPLQTLRHRVHDYPLGTELVEIILLAVLVGSVLRSRDHSFSRVPLSRWVVIFAVFSYISLWRGSIFLGTDLPLSFDDARLADWKNYLVMPLLFYVVATTMKDVKQIQLLVLCMCFSVLLIDRSFALAVKDRDFSQFSQDLRYAGPLGYAGQNGFAAFQAQMSLFLLGLYTLKTRKVLKFAILGLSLFTLYGVMFAFSRGAYVGVLAGVMFIGIFKERKFLIPVVAVLIGWQTLLPISVRERIMMTYDETGSLEISASSRVDLWKDALTLFSQNPLLGTGLNSYKYLHRSDVLSDTHNYFITVLVETGIFGLLLLLWLFVKCMQLGISLFRSAQDSFLSSLGLGFAALMVCAIVVNFFGDRWTYLQINGYLWVLLACVVRGHAIVEEGKQAAQADEEADVSAVIPLAQRASAA